MQIDRMMEFLTDCNPDAGCFEQLSMKEIWLIHNSLKTAGYKSLLTILINRNKVL